MWLSTLAVFLVLLARVTASQGLPTPTNYPTIPPTRYPTTPAPTPPPFQCADACYLGYLTDGQCDPECDVPSCNFDNGECGHGNCSTLPWISCMNTSHTVFSNASFAFYNQSSISESTFFCNATFDYYLALANCTQTYGCWSLFGEFMTAEGFFYDFSFCFTDADANTRILNGICPPTTCQVLLPGSPTSAPTILTPAPTYYAGPTQSQNVLLAAFLGAFSGAFVVIVLIALTWLFCTRGGLMMRLNKKELYAARLDREIQRIEDQLINETRGGFKAGYLSLQLERMEERREQLQIDLTSLRTQVYGEERAMEMAAQDSFSVSRVATSAAGTSVVVHPQGQTFEDIPLATIVHEGEASATQRA